MAIQDAEDLAQDPILKLMNAMESFAYDPTQRFRGYLKASARHALQAFWKQHRQRRISGGDGSLLEQLVEPEALETRINDQFDLDLLEEAKQRVQTQVSDRDWKIYVELTETSAAPDDLAIKLGMTRHAVDVAKYRVINRLRVEVRRLEECGIEEE